MSIDDPHASPPHAEAIPDEPHSNAPDVDREPGETDLQAMERAQKEGAERQEEDGGGYE